MTVQKEISSRKLQERSVSQDNISTVERESCGVCASRRQETVIELPDLPLTGKYSTEMMESNRPGFDQELLICADCGHVQLAKQVLPELLYSDSYSFRTSVSHTARKGTGYFLSMLDELTDRKSFSCILDIGCNDLYLLRQLRHRSRWCIGIDPIWASKEDQVTDEAITVIGKNIEDVDLASVLESPPDLIVCRHTLEHICRPQQVLQQLFEVASDDTLFLFEVPGFDVLMRRFRFDQIFHQHLQYFSRASFKELIEKVGGQYIDHRENYHDWGALLIAFKKGLTKRSCVVNETFARYSLDTICERYRIFQSGISVFAQVLESFRSSSIYGYGAAQMLPVLAYHLQSDLSFLEAVLDDDPAKESLYYLNLPLMIRSADSAGDLMESTVFVTAVDCASAIMQRLLVKRPKNILYPLNII